MTENILIYNQPNILIILHSSSLDRHWNIHQLY